MKTLSIKFSFRKIGDITPKSILCKVDVEKDSTDTEIDQQIKLYFREYIDEKSIVEILPYQIISTLSNF
jgi:hypothetical protein